VGAIIRVDGAKGAPFRLGDGWCLIGSSDGCDVVIKEPSVSRSHAELELVPEGVRVVDLGSREAMTLNHRIVKYNSLHPDRPMQELEVRVYVGAAQYRYVPATRPDGELRRTTHKPQTVTDYVTALARTIPALGAH
jgi:hypothetical protein